MLMGGASRSWVSLLVLPCERREVGLRPDQILHGQVPLEPRIHHPQGELRIRTALLLAVEPVRLQAPVQLAGREGIKLRPRQPQDPDRERVRLVSPACERGYVRLAEFAIASSVAPIAVVGRVVSSRGFGV